jgi:hypothetical protein
MRQFLTVVLVFAAVWAGWRFVHYVQGEMRSHEQRDTSGRYAPGKLPGLPAELEGGLAAAQAEGPAALQRWLAVHRAEIAEPRLTEIELDYVVLAGRTSAAEARRVLDQIGARIARTHPLYRRFEPLNAAYP